MSLLQKTLLILAVTLGGLLILLYLLLGSLLESRFHQLDLSEATEDVKHVHLFVFDLLQRDLDRLAHDWAAWNDTYEFVKDQNKAFIAGNMQPSTFDNAGLNFIGFLNTRGQLVYGRQRSAEKREWEPISPALLALFYPSGPFAGLQKTGDKAGGLIALEGAPMLVAARPIFDTNESKPTRGVLVMAHWLTEKRLEKAEKLLGRPIYLRSPDMMTAELRKRSEQRAGMDGYPIYLTVLNNETLAAYASLAGVDGTAVSQIEIHAPRNGYQRYLFLSWVLPVTLLFSGLVFAALFLTVLRTQVLGPVWSLILTVQKITRRDDVNLRVPVKGADETALLAKAFNEMLETISASRRELRKAKEDVEHAYKQKSEFVANLSHELRTPLNSILGFSEMILMDAGDETLRSHANVVLRESEALLELINDLLDHARLEAGRMELCRVPMRLSSYLEDLAELFQARAKAKGLSFCLEKDSELPSSLLCDPLHLQIVLQNLLSNALKFTEQGHVTLQVAQISAGDGHSVIRFAVEDTGIGISAEEQERIFEPFVQADGSASRAYGGSGLGVSIARDLVQLMGGTLCLTSEEDVGSCFFFSLELEHSQAENLPVPVGSTSDEVSSVTGAILVVEDYEPNRIVARQHLEAAGHRVTVVASGKEALVCCGDRAFDLVLMDLQMPDMDGYACARALLEQVDVPIAALTANTDGETEKRCREAGMKAILTKPLRRAAFLTSVDSLLRGREPVRMPMPPGGTERVFDADRALQEFSGNRPLLESVLHQFTASVALGRSRMSAALSSDDLTQVQAEAHRIRGTAGTLCAPALAAAFARVDQACSEEYRESRMTCLAEAWDCYDAFVERSSLWLSSQH